MNTQNTQNTTTMKNTPVKGRSFHRVSAYAMFQKDAEARQKVKATLGGDPSFGEISKGMSAAWKALPVDQKAVYEAQSEKAKTETSTSTTKTSKTTSKTTTKTATKTTGSSKKQKRARSAYTLFTMDEAVKSAVKQENPDADFGALSKLMGAKWKTLSAEEKKPYQEASEQEKATLATVTVSTTTTTTVVKTRKRARSAYTLYSSDPAVREAVKTAHPDADFGSQSKIIATQWKELPEEQKKKYQEASDQEKAEMTAAKLATGTTSTGKVRKRARSAYTLYTMDAEVKAKVKVDHPDADFTDFSKILAAQWKQLPEDQKKTYQEASEAEKTEMASQTVVSGNKKPKQKRAKSAYTLYSSDQAVREKVTSENPDADFGSISKIISAQWKALSPQLKKPYLDASAQEKSEMAAQKEANKPKKSRAKSAYLHYSMNETVRSAAKAAHPDKSVTELAKVLGAQWKALSEEERAPYKKAYDEEKAALEADKATSSE